jgi:hypothetical protein
MNNGKFMGIVGINNLRQPGEMHHPVCFCLFSPLLSRAHGLFDPAQEIKVFCGFKEDRLAAVAAKPPSGWRFHSRSCAGHDGKAGWPRKEPRP